MIVFGGSMYRLLIVDDEPLAVQGIESGVHWDTLGINEIYKASNIRQAKDVFASHQIDILLCDIEMPQGNGLNLLEWVREHSPATETIILTCHTDFEYARKALQLGSLDYVLKAMTYDELESVIFKAIRKIEKDKKLLEYSQLGELWSKNQPYLLEQFWLDILNGKIASDDESIAKTAAERNIPLTAGSRIRPMLVHIMPQGDEYRNYISEFDTAIKKTFGSEILGQIVQNDKENILSILFADPEKRRSQDAYKQILYKFIQTFKEAAACKLYIYFGDEIKVSGLSDMVTKLINLKKNNVALKNEIIFINTDFSQCPIIRMPDMGLWSSMISEKEYVLLINDIAKYFERMVMEGNPDSSSLQQFHQDFLQMVYSSLEQKKIQAHLLLNDAVSINLFDRATRSVADMLIWIKHVIARIQEGSLNNDDSLTIVEKVKRYIALHISDNPSREDLANYVFLNPDYLSRLFKKEMGMTLISYCQDMRLQYIKNLLSKTDMNIGKIAMQLGYSNFSHFTRAFKELTGISPTEYREKSKIQK